MPWSLKGIDDFYMEEEVIDTPPTEYIEENVYIDETFIKNKDLIRVDMNIIQFPIFSKNTQRKVNQVVTYFFNKNRETYIKVTPSAGDYIPGETEEKVFIALMQIMKEKNMPQKFVVKATELREKLKMPISKYNSIVKTSLSRLATANYAFKNTLYSSECKGVIGEEVLTTMFSLRTITLSKKENKKYKDMVNDKRVKEVYEITMSDHFYKNIIQKGYMVYNGNTLLEIESSTARTIYMLIEKLRFDNLYLKIDTIFLIKRIPLKYDKSHMTQTIKTLEKSLQDLIDKKLISNFRFLKDSTWAKSEIEISFFEESKIDKQNRFFEDRNDFRKIMTTLTVSNTEHAIIEDCEVVESIKVNVTLEMIEKILNIMPKKAKTLKTMPKTIKESIEKHGYEKVKRIAQYMKKQKVEKVRVYFIKALENDWGDDIEENIDVNAPSIPNKNLKLNLESKCDKYDESLYIEFEKLEIKIQNGIETYAYREYIKKCGMETKIQQLAFMGSRKKHICEYL
ncbi:hypothetical protein, partial [uncultured Cetobacterium sp.]|uniref:hypothetical protein n=1 Tax=uncultured Cetobacterium sp. TaxID=527638 RepID=UPI00260524A9